MPAQLPNLQRAFLGYILPNSHNTGQTELPPVPAELAAHIAPQNGLSAQDHLSVYVNNTRLILTSLLKTTFPATVALGGDKFFNYMAFEFIKTNPPKQADLTLYGAAFPVFMQTFAPLKQFPYMPDVAQLEWAREAAYHTPAPPAPPPPFSLWQKIGAGLNLIAPVRQNLTLAPSVHLLHSPWPIHQIWQKNVGENTEEIATLTAETFLLVHQAPTEIMVQTLPATVFHLLVENKLNQLPKHVRKTLCAQGALVPANPLEHPTKK